MAAVATEYQELLNMNVDVNDWSWILEPTESPEEATIDIDDETLKNLEVITEDVNEVANANVNGQQVMLVPAQQPATPIQEISFYPATTDFNNGYNSNNSIHEKDMDTITINDINNLFNFPANEVTITEINGCRSGVSSPTPSTSSASTTCYSPSSSASSRRNSEMSIIDSSDSESGFDEYIPRNNRPRKREQNRRAENISHFLYRLLLDSKKRHIIEWIDMRNGEFKIKSQEDLARLWGQRPGKSNENMTYSNLARTIRYHYKKSKGKEIEMVRRKMVYRFTREFLNKRSRF